MHKQIMNFINQMTSAFKLYLPTWLLLIGMVIVTIAVGLLFGSKWAVLLMGVWLIVNSILINKGV